MTSRGGELATRLSAPDADRPALANPTTAILLEAWSRRIGPAVPWLLLALVQLMAAVAGFLGGNDAGDWWAVVTCIASIIIYLNIRAKQSRLRAARRLLAEQSWRPVPAVVAAAGRTVDLAGYRVMVAGWSWPAARLVAARTGRVWVIGPGSARWMVLRVDGAPTMHLAWRTPGRAPRSPLPVPPGGTSGTAVDDPVTAALAVRIHQRVNRWIWVPVLSLAVVLGISLLLWGGITALVASLLTLVAFAMVAVVRLRREWADRAVPELLRRGPWRQVPVTLRPWQARRDGTAMATGTVTVDGVNREILLPNAGVELLGAIWDTATVWLAGDLEPGPVAAGFPGYPLLGLARLS